MSSIKIVRTLIDYHLALTRKVWESIDQITEAQFLQEDGYSRGSVRNLMVHLASTDRRWLAGLRNLPEVGNLDPGACPDRASARRLFDEVAVDLAGFVAGLDLAALDQHPADIPSPRWAVLIHLVNHGTDHRATVLQKLHEFGAPTFGQDLILWLWDQDKEDGRP
jgi:uncharacterized damage-inducible protein DinB